MCMCVSVWVYATCVWAPVEAGRGHQIPWGWTTICSSSAFQSLTPVLSSCPFLCGSHGASLRPVSSQHHQLLRFLQHLPCKAFPWVEAAVNHLHPCTQWQMNATAVQSPVLLGPQHWFENPFANTTLVLPWGWEPKTAEIQIGKFLEKEAPFMG